jgi:hypothetical protein
MKRLVRKSVGPEERRAERQHLQRREDHAERDNEHGNQRHLRPAHLEQCLKHFKHGLAAVVQRLFAKHANVGLPNTTIDSLGAGQITSVQVATRRMQFALHVRF